MVNVPGYVRGSGGKKQYAAGDVTIYVDEEDGINDITLRSVFAAISQDPEIPNKHFSKKKPYGPVNGQWFYFPSEGGGILSKGRKFIRPAN